ncbi:N-acetylglutamate synthase-like GNAT family acetyltransferase [Pedobacter sp. UYP30]|uniref:GNAT family N-acetyltransferase n=1 Tax=Pedobacter sp. UYP30 TaxID=1756400 RepID=UPI0033968510
MKIELLQKEDVDELYDFIVNTIKVSYSEFYPEEAITHFIQYSNKKEILKDIDDNYVIVLKDDSKIIGTGTLKQTHIKRVFVQPNCQGMGFGKLIMTNLEQKAKSDNFKMIELHSSLFAKSFYDGLGYKMFKIGKVNVENGEILYFQRMAKNLSENKLDTNFDFHQKQFKVIKNDGYDVEVNEQTIFLSHQKNELIYAEYKGGSVKYGEIFGVINNNQIDFYYNQENLRGQNNQGQSHGEIKIINGNKLQLINKWQWKSKDGNGLCLLEET